MPGSRGIGFQVLCTEPALRAQVERAVAEIGGKLVDAVDQAGIIVVDGEDPTAIEALRISRGRAAEVLGLSPSEPPEGLDRATDLLFKPVSMPQLVARLRRLKRRRVRAIRRDDLLAMAVEATSDVVEIADAQGALEYVNEAFDYTLGYGLGEVVGRPASEVARSQLHDDGFFREIDEATAAGRSWSGLMVAKAKDGRLVRFESTVSPVLDETGSVLHRVSVKRDVTAASPPRPSARLSTTSSSRLAMRRCRRATPRTSSSPT